MSTSQPVPALTLQPLHSSVSSRRWDTQIYLPLGLCIGMNLVMWYIWGYDLIYLPVLWYYRQGGILFRVRVEESNSWRYITTLLFSYQGLKHKMKHRQILACKLWIKNQKSVFKNQYSITKDYHNLSSSDPIYHTLYMIWISRRITIHNVVALLKMQSHFLKLLAIVVFRTCYYSIYSWVSFEILLIIRQIQSLTFCWDTRITHYFEKQLFPFLQKHPNISNVK